MVSLTVLTLQSLLGSIQLLLLLRQLHSEFSGREHVSRAAALGLLQVLTQHVLHLPQQVHLFLELGHLFTQQNYNWQKRKRALAGPREHVASIRVILSCSAALTLNLYLSQSKKKIKNEFQQREKGHMLAGVRSHTGASALNSYMTAGIMCEMLNWFTSPWEAAVSFVIEITAEPNYWQ